MRQNEITAEILDQTKDLIWVVDSDLTLVYANKSYLNLMKEVTGFDKELNTPILVEGFGEGYIEKWKGYYNRALSGEYFEIEEHYYNPGTNDIQYGQITFTPLVKDIDKIHSVACRSTDITRIVKHKSEANQLMDASLDTFCTINEAGNFVFVSAVSADHWGYHPEELIGKPYRDLIVEEDLEKTDLVAAEILAGREIKSFSNRYRKKNGDIAYNLWSVRWDHESKLMYCVARDAKEKIEEEAEKELLSQISLSFNDEEELIPAANRLCENLYTFGKFDLIELWCPKMEHTQIMLIGHSNHTGDFYELEPSEASFQKDDGLPGKVWQKGKQLLWDEKQINKNFIRKKGAAHLGIKAILGIPLTFNHELVGVLLIGTKRDPEFLKLQIPVLSRLDKYIGSEINRKRLEVDLKHLYQAIPDILCIADFNGRFLKMNPAGCELLGYNEEEILFHPFDEFVHPGDKDVSTKEVEKLETGANTFQFENRYITKEGKIIWLNWSCNSSPQEGLIYASAKNITAEVQLRELNTQASSLAKIGSWEIDLEKNTVFWSKMVHQLHETDRDSFTPDLETGINFYREDFRTLVRSSIEKSINTGECFDFEAVIVTKKLKERWVRAIGNVETVNGIAKRIYGSFQDITDRKESELRLQTLSDDLPGVTFQYVIMPDGKDSMHSVSKASINIWGLSPEDCEKNNDKVWNQIKKGGDFNEVQQSIQQSIASGEKWHFRWRNVLPKGKLRWHEGFGTPNKLPDGTVIFNSMIFDITDEKKAVDLYQQALAERATILESISDAFYAVDANWNFTYFNKEAENLLKKSADEVLGGNIWEIFAPAKGTVLEEIYIRVASTGQSENFEYHYPGDGCWYEVTTYPSAGGVASYFKNIDQRRKAAQELQKAYKERSNILESISDNFYALNSKFKFTYMNSSCAELLQVDASEIINENLFDRFPYLKNTLFETQLLETQRTGKPVKFEFFYEPYQRWFNESIYLNNDGFSVYFYDITKIKEAEKQILEKNEQLTRSYEEKNNILESIGDAFFAVDNEWMVTYWNNVAEKSFQKNKNEIVGNNLWEVYQDAIDSDFYTKYHFAMETMETQSFEAFYESMNQWLEVTAYPSKDGLSVYFRDITQRKKANEEVAKSEEKRRLIMNGALDAIVTIDTNETITFWNPQSEVIFGWKAEEVMGKPLSETIIPESFRKYHVEGLKNYLKTGEGKALNVLLELSAIRRNGEEFPIELTVLPIKQGSEEFFCAFIRDITQRKKAERELLAINEKLSIQTKELERSNEELEQFAFITSHDLQEPLRMISSFMDLLKKKYSDQLDDKALQYIYFATDGAKRMKQIILDLLLYSRANKITEVAEDLDLNELLSEYKSLRKKLIAEKAAIVESSELPHIKTFRAPITQILHCLLDNALKYTKENIPPQIQISFKENETEWEFAIKDNGIGIDNQFFDKIFIIFQRLHNRDIYNGTGIGLSIAKRSVEFMGGRIWLTSEVGQGSIFYFTIPKNK